MNRSSVDTKELEKALDAIDFKGGDLLNIEGAGAAVLVNGMRMRVAVDTAATKNGVQSHIESQTDEQIVDEVGPETTYAPNIEYGVSTKPNYPIQPFVRPTVQEDFDKVIRAIGTTFGSLVVNRWPK
jgi:hypothetical protein